MLKKGPLASKPYPEALRVSTSALLGADDVDPACFPPYIVHLRLGNQKYYYQTFRNARGILQHRNVSVTLRRSPFLCSPKRGRSSEYCPFHVADVL